MGSSPHRPEPHPIEAASGDVLPSWPKWVKRWMLVCTLCSGLFALLWLVLRTGTKPSRFAYPCQQAALASATAAFGAPLVATILACRGQLVIALRSARGKIAAGASVALITALLAMASFDTPPDVTRLMPPPNYTPQVFLVNDARGIEPGRYGGVDDLITLMGVHGLKLHRSQTHGLTAGPDGLIDVDDVVVIKINAQWAERGGTNTDVLRGIIRRIVEHPDGFVGEIIVADNGQGSGNLNHPQSNAEDHGQSSQDVITDFANEGWNVTGRLWDGLRWNSVDEYADEDIEIGYVSGYVVDPILDYETDVRVSYPKWQSASGTYISYKYGIWSPDSATYDSDKLVVINVPVFKTHFIYAITAAVKNHMGVVTRELGTDSHYGIARGGLGSFLAEVRMPDVTILDCIWILARPGSGLDSGPASFYTTATPRDQLLAGTDPVALDMWATKFIMIPQIILNNFPPSTYESTQNPDNPLSRFREYLDKSMNEMLIAGIRTSNDYDAVELHLWAGDVDRDGDLDLEDFSGFDSCITGPDSPIDPTCTAYDFDANHVLDLADLAKLQNSFTGSQ